MKAFMHVFEEIKTLRAKEKMIEQRNIASLKETLAEIRTMMASLPQTTKKAPHPKRRA